MDQHEVQRYWDANAPAWARLARAGYDRYRDHLNTPEFLAFLPEVRGQVGVDIGCGEGHNTRLLARDRGARMHAIDFAEAFIRLAREEESREPLGIVYQRASATELPFDDAAFDFATSFMCLMDFAETDRALVEAHRVIRPGGFLQFSISHPCFDTPHRRTVRDETGRVYAVEVGRYFDRVHGRVDEWTFSAAPPELRAEMPKFRVPYFRRTLSDWVRLIVDAGFTIEAMHEPCPSPETAAAHPEVADAVPVPYFLHIRVRKK